MENGPISQDEIDALLNAMGDKGGESSEKKQDTSEDEETGFQASSKPILSQDEINALLNVMPSMKAESSSTQAKPIETKKIISSRNKKANIEKYDFTQPSQLSKDHLKALNSLHGSYARSLSSYFSMSLRTAVEIECTSIEQLTYGEYLSSLFDPTCVGVFGMKPLRGVGMIEIALPLAFPMIDILLGGPGNTKPYNRTLTVIEETIIMRVMERTLSTLQESWERSIEIKIKLERVENNPQFIQASASGDPVILILFDVKLDNAHGMMSLCFPFLTIQQSLTSLKREESPAFVDDEAMKLYKAMMQKHVRQIYLPISVRYSPSPVTLGELIELKKGDVVILQNTKKDQVQVLIAGKNKYYGKPGMTNGKRAVQISGAENDEENEGVEK
jgi:flagellar motor switch protein FliM